MAEKPVPNTEGLAPPVVNVPSKKSPLGGFPTDYVPPTVTTRGDPIPVGPQGLAGPGTSTAPTTGGGFTQDVQSIFGTTPHKGFYYPGDQWTIPHQVPGQVYEIKKDLYDAGLLTVKTVGNPHVWTPHDAKVFTRILDFANGNGVDWKTALGYFVSNPTYTSTHSTGTGTPANYTSPVDVQQTYQNVSQQLTGQEAPAPADFTAQYHQAETNAAHATGAAYAQAPTVANSAAQYIQTNNPSDVQAYGVASRMLDFFNMVGVK
jgi:hypothetical protein